MDRPPPGPTGWVVKAAAVKCRHRAKVTGPLTSREDIFAGRQHLCSL